MLTREWFSLTELLAEALPGMPESRAGYADWAERNGWNEAARKGDLWRKRPGRGGGMEYHFSALPLAAKVALSARYTAPETDAKQAAREEFSREDLWDWFARQPEKKQAEARRRLAVLRAVDDVVQSGVAKGAAVQMVCREQGLAPSGYYRWEALTHGVNRSDWLPALAPRHGGERGGKAECSAAAWEWLKGAWLRPERPTIADCYRDLRRVAREQGWAIPSEKTLERRLQALPEAVRVFHREGGVNGLKRLLPAQQRDKSGLHALQVVNLDDHKFDVFVKWEDGTIGRPHLEAIQDVYSGMLLSWRIDRSENSQTIRLAIHDMIEEWGIPEEFVFDNTRAAANKQITGGAPNRFRFKVKDEDPAGLIEDLGAKVRFTTPYHGQAKPIERMFRDFAGSVAKDPRFAGAYTGNNPTAKPSNYGSSAVPIDRFREVLAERIEEHNSRPGRTAAVCAGRSFRETFMASYDLATERTLIPRATAVQRRKFLLSSEAVTVRREQPMIHLAGNRYFAEFLLDLRGQRVVIRFDADALHDGVHVEALDLRYLGHAECVEAAGFSDLAAARATARRNKRLMRALREVADAEAGMSITEVAALLPKIEREEAARPEPKVVRGLFNGNAALKPAPAAEEEADAHSAGEARMANALKIFAQRMGPRLVQPDEE